MGCGVGMHGGRDVPAPAPGDAAATADAPAAAATASSETDASGAEAEDELLDPFGPWTSYGDGHNHVHLVGYTERVQLYMRLADVLVGKPGPGVISEGAAQGSWLDWAADHGHSPYVWVRGWGSWGGRRQRWFRAFR
jgi:hypothetical protein